MKIINKILGNDVMRFLKKLLKTSKLKLASIICIAMVPTGCKKLVDVPTPITSVNSANVFTTDNYAIAAVTNLYANMSGSSFLNGNGSYDLTSLSLFPSLSADELSLFPGNAVPCFNFYTNSLSSATIQGEADFWIDIYKMLYTINSAVEGLNSSNTLTPTIKQQLLGEEKFMRAFCYFYLVNLYGDVPLALTSNYKVNESLPRTPKDQVYKQIISDLTDAQSQLSKNYLDGTLLTTTTEKVRPTKWAAAALLARVYLYYGNLTGDASNYTKAETESSLVINNTSLFSLSSLNNVFLANSTEAIWQLQPINFGQNSADAVVFVLPPVGPNTSTFPVYLNPALVNSFEPGDQRKANWVGSITVTGTTYNYPYKYKVATNGSAVSEYEMVMRLGEQFLIRAEASAEGGTRGLSGAISDLNVVRSRAGLGSTTATSQTQILNAIQQERRVELFTEWGNRWFDLKRTGTVNTVMGGSTGACQAKGGTWNTNWQLYPISLYELQHDPNLVQNPGY
jgi:hypothetical protein